MAELTIQQIEDAVMRGLRAGGLNELIDARAKDVFHREFATANAEKFEKTLGVNCMDPEAREATRKDMEYTRTRRLYAESERGVAEHETLRSLAKAINASAFHLSRIIITGVVIGFLALAVFGASQKGWIGEFMH